MHRKKEIKTLNCISHLSHAFFSLSAIMKHGKQGGNWLQRSTVEQRGLKHKDESQHTTTTCSINTARPYLWVMEADTRLDWHVLVWALRSLLRPTANKERGTLTLIFLINFSLKIHTRHDLRHKHILLGIEMCGWNPEWLNMQILFISEV